MRHCSTCGLDRPLSDFYVRNGRATTPCKECAKAKSRAWYEAHRDRALSQMRAKRGEPDYATYMRWYAIHRKYGITREQYDSLLKSQGGACAICRYRPEEGFFLHVDHCHDTGRIRGLLCTKCNPALGFMGDDPALLRAAAAYLEQA